MKLYFECKSGAAGDMLASALLGLFDNRETVLKKLNSLSLPHTEIVYSEKEQCGIKGVHLNMVIDGETEEPESAHHHSYTHRTLNDIYGIIESLNADDKVKNDIKNIYKIIAEAEAKAHGAPVSEVHFHELGMLDAVADIAVCAFLINELNPEKILASSVNAGNGTVKCAHGILPVPAPATANILTDVPYYKSDIQTELCTPTGAALLKYYTDEFTDEPLFISVNKIGTGTGTKELPQANILRVFEFESSEICELSCNIDDMTGEEAGFAAEVMMNKGALDCFITPVFMKKGRPGYQFTVLCNADKCKYFARLIFKHTSTIGIRKYTPSRYTLDRTLIEKGGVCIKRSEGYGVIKEKAEFEDIKKAALEKDISLFEARDK